MTCPECGNTLRFHFHCNLTTTRYRLTLSCTVCPTVVDVEVDKSPVRYEKLTEVKR